MGSALGQLGQPSLERAKAGARCSPRVPDYLGSAGGFALGLTASKTVSTTGEGTVVDILLGIVGAVAGGWLFNLLGGTGVGGFNMNSVYSAGVAAVGATVMLAVYHVFFRRRML